MTGCEWSVRRIGGLVSMSCTWTADDAAEWHAFWLLTTNEAIRLSGLLLDPVTIPEILDTYPEDR